MNSIHLNGTNAPVFVPTFHAGDNTTSSAKTQVSVLLTPLVSDTATAAYPTGRSGTVAPAINITVNRTYQGRFPKDGDWDSYNKSFDLEALTVAGIANAITQGYAITAAHHTNRETDNFISAQHLGLDFDSEDDNSRLSALLSNPFIDRYAAIIHTTGRHTPDTPRARVLFTLDKPVRDAAQYSRYAQALVWKFGRSDQNCKDAVRVWFGYVGCEIHVNESAVLPVAVLDTLVAEQQQAQSPADRPVIVTGDPLELLDAAIRDGVPGHRHDAGFNLCRGLRDIGLSRDQAVEYVELYQSAVGNTGDHDYTLQQAFATLRSTYRKPPMQRRQNDEQLQERLAAWEYAAWVYGRGLKQGGIHYALKTLMAISEIAEKAGRTENLDLPLRGFMKYGVRKNTADNHLAAMVEAGVLRKVKKSNSRKGNSYSLIIPDIPEDPTPSPFDITMTDTYKQLQDMPHFAHGARIDVRLWRSEPPAETLGPAAQRIVAALAMMVSVSNCQVPRLDNQKKGEYPSLRDCPTVALDSLNDLYKLAGVSPRTGKRTFNLLVKLGVCAVETSPDSYKAKIPSLTDNWYERLLEIAPALTTFGHIPLVSRRYAGQRAANHERFANFGREDDRQLSQTVADHARADKAEFDKQIKALNEQRIRWAASIGIPADSVPHITLHTETRTQPIRQPVGAHGRKVIPTVAKTGKNRRLIHELDRETALRRYAELSDGRALFGNQAQELRSLAQSLGLPVNIERIELND